MASLIGWIALLAPIIFSFFKKVGPKIGKGVGKIGGKGGPWIAPGTTVASTYAHSGVLGVVIFLLAKIWGWLSKFPPFLKTLFASGGKLYFIRRFFEFVVTYFKSPILIVISLVTSVLFPTIIEKFFLCVGAVSLKIFLFFFKIGKNIVTGAIHTAGENGGDALDEFRDMILGSFDELPPCMIQTMGYLHLVEDLGIFMTTMSILIIVSVFRMVYGRVGGITGNSYGLG